MYDRDTRDGAVAQMARGQSLRSISLSTGISRAALREWRDHPGKSPIRRLRHCPRCAESPTLPEPGADYAYLLGQYLGDGCISVAGNPAKGVFVLRIACADAWPGVMADCRSAISAVRPANKVGAVQAEGCTAVLAYSRHWPCLFPQHGPGMKHNRKIELESWQQTITSQHPGAFARGLFHSDGCRFINRVRRPLASGDRWYEYPRYMFTNESRDILEVCGATLDRLGVSWRFSRRNTISVARRDAVARLDQHVGPKY